MRSVLLSLVLASPFAIGFVACASTDSQPDKPSEDAGTIDSAKPPGQDAAGDATDLPLPARTACASMKTGTAGVVYQGTLLLPNSVVEGELFVKDGAIVCAAASCSTAAGFSDASVVKCTDTVISPGLINPHDHLSFANGAPAAHGTERYEHRHDWRKGLRGHTKITAAGGASADTIRAAELRFIMSGATSVAGAGGATGLLRNLDVNAANLEGLAGVKIVNSDTFPLKDSAGALVASGCGTYSATRVKTGDITQFDGYLPHISEGIDNEAHNEFVCQNSDPNDLVQKQTAIVHGIAVTPADIALYRADQTALVWSPRSNIDLYGDTASVIEYDNLGVQISLGTDWLASGSMNMARELACVNELNDKYFAKHFSDEAIWRMVTTNSAFAVGMTKHLGMLKPGYVADIAFFDARKNTKHAAVTRASAEDVVLVLRGGEALYGDANVLDLAPLKGAACEALDVCGTPKKACIKQDEPGTDLAKVKAAGDAVYPLFFCKSQSPTKEPSCTPFREAYKAGASATDKDGDGIDDAADNCPDVFNPKRPMYNNEQGDSDGDGKGDACDPCPLATDNTCTKPSADDIDGDGIPNGIDTCPELADADQADDDKDGKGNACDTCPTSANPGASQCVAAFTINELRDSSLPTHPAAGSLRAKISGVYVTGVKTKAVTPSAPNLGFFVQLGTSKFSGLFVNTGTVVPTVQVGNQVDVVGLYEELFSMTTLSQPAITVVDGGTTLPFAPVVLDPASIATGGVDGEGYECMLVQIDGPSVTVVNPDGAKDFDEFSVTGGLRIDDDLYEVLDNAYPLGTVFPKITGVAGFAFANRKVWPRSANDLL
jgi:cytosine/adenosine deaminase-related metal-dependent hydrolase